MASVSLSGLWLSQQVWQLGDVHRNPAPYLSSATWQPKSSGVALTLACLQ
jgi:hypothetical protein